MKIIVQAGGVGSRLKFLTRTKPKGLVSAKYLPLMFHLFKKYPKDEFIIIGDYKFEILEQYLNTFAKNINFILIKSVKKGNVAGLSSAISFIPANEPFMLIWSDLILSENFAVHEIKKGCQVGIADFPCSWSLQNGKLIHKEIPGAGVGGLFIFNNKSWLMDVPEEGSFTDWLANQPIPFYPISLRGSLDVGTLDAYEAISPSANRCRPYNKIEFVEGKVVKSGLTEEAVTLIKREIDWYDAMSRAGFEAAPQIYESEPLTMEYIAGTNVFLKEASLEEKKLIIEQIVSALSRLHKLSSAPASSFDLYNEYFKKTLHRLQSIATALPFATDSEIKINGKKRLNVLRHPHVLRSAVLSTLMNLTSYTPIHGDCQLTNTLISDEGKIYFIDPRGYFGKSKVLGDPRYDWAKVWYSIEGNFDQFNIKNFDLSIDDEGIDYSIHTGGWEEQRENFLRLLPSEESTPKELELIHAIIWLSMASHAWEDFDSMCVAYFNGLRLFDEWLHKYA